ncbi:MAG: dolichyl-phosphate-mannose--protein mannosyltransferase [Carbonactinosporaceae bacterium]
MTTDVAAKGAHTDAGDAAWMFGAGAGRAGAARPSLRDRLSPPMPPGVLGWVGPLVIAAIAGVLRFVRLGDPHALVFDETYYAKDAWSLLRFGYERNWEKGADDSVLAGRTDVIGDGASFVVHPPFGKWLMAVGEWAFGMDPFGWRFAVALLGTLSVLMIARIARRLTRSTLLGCTAGLLLAFDGLHFVMSRTALLDLILMFWVLAAFGCLLVDRDRTRARVGEAVDGDPPLASGLGPGFGLRPWRIAAGVCLGLACATKWNGLFFVVAFGLLTVLWDVGTRRALGTRHRFAAVLVRDAGPAFAAIVLVGVVAYLATWWGWWASDAGWDRHWADGRDTVWFFVPDGLRSLWHYHAGIYDFHRGLDSYHPYRSSPWGWLVLARPVSYFYENLGRGDEGCEAARCAQEVLGIGTPALWWTALGALVFLIWRWAGRRDWRAGAVLAGIAAGYLPWFAFSERTIFYFYAIVFTPFLVLGVTLLLGAILGPPGSDPRRRAWGACAAGLVVLLVVANFIYFYPVLSAEPIPLSEWAQRMWLQSWI